MDKLLEIIKEELNKFKQIREQQAKKKRLEYKKKEVFKRARRIKKNAK